MKLIYAQGFSKNEKMEWKPVVFTNVIQSFRLIFDAMNDLGIKFEYPDNEASSQHPPANSWRSIIATSLTDPPTEKHGSDHG